MKLKMIKASIVGVLLSCSSPLFATPTAYLPIGMDAQLDHQLDTLFALTSGTPMAKPYRLAEVETALTKLKNSEPALVAAIRAKIKPYQSDDAITRVGVKLQLHLLVEPLEQIQPFNSDRAEFRVLFLFEAN